MLGQEKGRRRPQPRSNTLTSSQSPPRADGTTPTSPAGGGGNNEVIIKLIGVGDGSTGKTTFFQYWETNRFTTSVKLTVSVDFHKREMNVQLPPKGYVSPMNALNVIGGDASSSPSSPAGSPSPIRGSGGPTTATAAGGGRCDSQSLDESSPSLARLDNNASSASQAILRAESELDPAIRRDFRIIAPTPIDFGPTAETIPALVQVWDVQGQERIKNLTRIFYDSAMGALVFCESKSAKSLEGAAQWKADIDSKVFVSVPDPDAPPQPEKKEVRSFRLSSAPAAAKPSAPAKMDKKIPCWLVVNKCDLLAHNDQPAPLCMSAGHLDQFVKEHGFVGWSYASGLKGVHVKETVAALLSRVAERFPDEVRAKSTVGKADEGAARPNGRLRNDGEKKRQCCGSS